MQKAISVAIGVIIGIIVGFFINVIAWGLFSGVVLGSIGLVIGVLNGTFPDYVVTTFGDAIQVGAVFGVFVSFINLIRIIAED